MVDILIVFILIFCIGSAICYIVKEKKSGAKCIGCPYSKKCDRVCDNKNKKEE